MSQLRMPPVVNAPVEDALVASHRIWVSNGGQFPLNHHELYRAILTFVLH